MSDTPRYDELQSELLHADDYTCWQETAKLACALERENAALRAVKAAARNVLEYSHYGAAEGWPDWEKHFVALQAAIDAAREVNP